MGPPVLEKPYLQGLWLTTLIAPSLECLALNWFRNTSVKAPEWFGSSLSWPGAFKITCLFYENGRNPSLVFIILHLSSPPPPPPASPQFCLLLVNTFHLSFSYPQSVCLHLFLCSHLAYFCLLSYRSLLFCLSVSLFSLSLSLCPSPLFYLPVLLLGHHLSFAVCHPPYVVICFSHSLILSLMRKISHLIWAGSMHRQ